MPVLLRTLLFTLIVPGTVAGWLPWWYVGVVRANGAWGSYVDLGPWRHAGWLLVAAGVAGYVRCAFDFSVRGEGTPSPLDPPRRFVATGLYRHLRNPIYACVAVILLGEVLLYEAPRLAIWPVLLLPGFHLFVVLYEEPTLARVFGSSYEVYRRQVPRWIPRLRPRG